MRCKWWDCGWCYAPDGKQSNDDNGQCNKPEQCKELERQEHEQGTGKQSLTLQNRIGLINLVKIGLEGLASER